MATLALIPYEPHPHVLLIMDLIGHKPDVPNSFDPDDDSYLKSLDPKDWKTHDMYAILGLKQLRHLASPEDIRRAYRKKLLTHHPDKRRSHGEEVKDESHDYFSCITIAYEILGNPTKRHAYDSVDPVVVDESYPSASEIKADYFTVLHDFFARKARWSKVQPVPSIGSMQTSLDDVHQFYDFWETYDTTRDFSFLDEEDKEKGEDREARRAIERHNRAERARRRTEELRIIHQVVELARSNDPRLIAAANAAKEAKAAKRQARLDAIKQKREADEQLAAMESERLAAARAASEERRKMEAERVRKERELTKQEARRERRRLRDLVVGKYDHFIQMEPVSVDRDTERVRILAAIDLLGQRLSVTQLQQLNDHLDDVSNIEAARTLFKQQHDAVQKELQAPGLVSTTKSSQRQQPNAPVIDPSKCSTELCQTLIKAVNLLPAGTPKRWEAIAAYVNQHVPGSSLSPKEALKQAKALSQGDANLRKLANEKAFDSFASSVRSTDAVKNVTITSQLEAEATRPWTITEQRALEEALRSFPAEVATTSGGDRWQRIADFVGTRTRRECMLRCKELSRQVRAKKVALDTANCVVDPTVKPAQSTEPLRK